jgi:hypothetical protein
MRAYPEDSEWSSSKKLKAYDKTLMEHEHHAMRTLDVGVSGIYILYSSTVAVRQQ